MTQPSPDYRILLQEAWYEMRQMRLELEALTAQTTEPIAIIGMDCRFPGGANSPEAYWDLLQNGVDAITEVPSDHWDLAAYYDPDPDAPGKLYSRHGGFIDQVDQFDPQFFGISPREAISLDPQQRLLLEVSYTALERAGQAIDRLQGSQTGVYIGISFEDYAKLSLHSGDLTRIDAYSSLGNTRSIGAGRLAYVLGLQGPTMQLDTTCSSSLLAVHLACQSLRSGESNLALAGGVNLMLSPEPTIGFCKLKALSPDGHCRTFDANANGYARGEGCGIVVLKRLADAVANRDPVLAVIRGSAVNHDGQSNGLTAPNGQAQEAVMRQAMHNANVEATQVQYVEAHGTGTPLGDPIEVLALAKVLGEGRSADQPLWIGSVKTNFGHLESAAGVAGLIKTVLALQHRQIPPHLHFQQPNPHIPWKQLAVKVPTQLTTWQSQQLRLAGVSSFGMSGTNAHVIVEEFVNQKESNIEYSLEPRLFTLSAKSQPALRQLAERYEAFLEKQPDTLLPHICFTANIGRSQFEHRFAVTVSSIDQLRQQLRQFIQNRTIETPASSLARHYLEGGEINWSQLGYTKFHQRVVLPTYPFQKQRYWMEPPVLRSRDGHPLLGKRLALANSTKIHFEAQLDPSHLTFLQQHRVFGQPIMPAAGYVEMALAAGREMFQSGQLAVEIAIYQPLPLDRPMTVQLTLTELKTQKQCYEFEIFVSNDANNQNSWKRYASGTVSSINSINDNVDISALKVNCTEIDTDRFYDTYRQHGIEYGAAFQAVRQLWQADRKAIARIKLPANCPSAAPYQIHPVLLDAGLQTIAAALSSQTHTYLPVGIEQLIVHSNQLPYWSEVGLRSLDYSSHPIADLRLLDANGQVIVTIKGLKLQPAKPEEIKPLNLQDWLYQVEWRPQPLEQFVSPTLSDSSKFDALSIVQTIVQNQELNQYQQLISQLESLSLNYITHAFLKLGWQFTINDQFSTHQLIQQLGITADPKFIQRLLDILVEAQFLDYQANHYRVIQPLHTVASDEITQSFDSPERVLLHRCGSSLAEMLQGKCNPIQLLFPNGDLTTLSQIYQDSAGAQFINQLVQQVVKSVLPQNNVRILEIGGGTGGTTSYLLPYLNAQSTEYTFTDISPLFIQRAQQKFADYDFMRYRTLDIERSPQDQGFRSHQCDLIIAANVLHATRNLQATLAHVHQLLAPGGMLILLEGIHPMRWLDLTFGLTEGWWQFTDRALRPNYPLISVEQWQQVLQQSGFASVEAIHPTVNGSNIQQAVIVAQVNAAAPPQRADFDWLIVTDRQGVGEALAHRLQADGASYRLVYPTDQLNVTLTRSTQIVFLPALDAPDPTELTIESLDAASENICSSALDLVQSLSTTQPVHLWLVTQGAVATGTAEKLTGLAQSLLWGIGKTIRLEHPEFNCVCVDLDPDPTTTPAQRAELLLAEIDSSRQASLEPEVAFRQQQRYVARLSRCQTSFTANSPKHSQQTIRLETSQRGTLENLQLQTVERQVLQPHEVEICVQATGLNFRDLLNALDLYPGEAGLLGCECVGEISAVGEQVTVSKPGDRVMALATGSFSNWITVDAAMVAPVPEFLSSEAAATIPVTFLTASYALRHLAQLKRGERVLIHAATGGVGQAAIQIAKQIGAEIYATASPEKWDVLRAMGISAVFNSRNLEFATDLMQSEGVDVVLNSLAGEFIPQSLSILNPNGRFVELGKTDWNDNRVKADYPSVNYFQMDLMELCQQQPDLIQRMLQDTVEKIQQRIYQPLPYSVFPITKVVQAFRTMQQAKHVGKIVVTSAQADFSRRVDQTKIRSDGTYLITGGLSGLGLLVAEWLVQQGAKHLVLISRHAAKPQQIQAWEQAGVQVVIAAVDVAEQGDLSQFLTTVEQSLPPIRGVIHAAGVLEDAMLHQQTWQKFATVLRPKLLGAWNLHQLTQSQPLDFYILFSSATALFGSPGQANHVAANIFLDAFAHYRRSLNLPTLSINWGIWSDVGSAAARQAETKLKGIDTISPAQGIEAFAALLSSPFTQVGVMPMHWSEFLQQGVASPFFAKVQPSRTTVSQSSILQDLKLASADRRSLLQNYLYQQIAQVLGFHAAEIDPQKGFFDLGMDSLTSVELKNRLQTDLDCILPATVAFDYPTIETLTDYLNNLLNGQLHQTESKFEATPQSEIVTKKDDENLDNLSQAELAKLLAQELSDTSWGRSR